MNKRFNERQRRRARIYEEGGHMPSPNDLPAVMKTLGFRNIDDIRAKVTTQRPTLGSLYREFRGLPEPNTSLKLKKIVKPEDLSDSQGYITYDSIAYNSIDFNRLDVAELVNSGAHEQLRSIIKDLPGNYLVSHHMLVADNSGPFYAAVSPKSPWESFGVEMHVRLPRIYNMKRERTRDHDRIIGFSEIWKK